MQLDHLLHFPFVPHCFARYSHISSINSDLYLLDDEAKVGGATLTEAVEGTDKPSAGGVLVTNVTATDTPEGKTS